MIRMLAAEWMKLKRTRGFWLLVLAVCSLHLLELFSILNQTSPGRLTWDWTFYIHYKSMTVGLFPVMNALLIGYLIAAEFQQNTISGMLAYPLSRSSFLLAKYAIAVPVLAGLLALDLLLKGAAGWIVGFEPMTAAQWGKYAWCSVLLLLTSIAFFPLNACLSLYFRSYIPNIVLGVMIIVCCEAVWDRLDYSARFPWTFPAVVIGDYIGIPKRLVGSPELLSGALLLTAVFTIFLILSFVQIRRQDIRPHGG